jgi:uncharacterized membrane protein YedE/YeeE
MTQPDKVIGFLDIFGQWNPSLMFVMGAAVIVTAVGYRLVWKREHPLIEDDFNIPTYQALTPDLILGAALFGIGWGISGLCPGPALVSLVTGSLGIYVFVATMFFGFYAAPLVTRK